MTANVITYRGRSAAREVGKALGFDVDTLDRLSSLVRALGMEGPERHAGAPVPRCRSRSDESAHPQILRALPGRAGSAAASGPALGRHGDLPGAARFGGAAGARHHAGPRGGAVGQGRLRRHGHHQGGSAGPGHDGGAQRFASNADPRVITAKKWTWRTCRRTIRMSTARCSRPTRWACSRWRAARRWRACRACAPKQFYDIVVEVAHHPPRAHRGQNGASVSEAAAGPASRSIICIRRSSRCSSARSACRCFRSSCCAWP